MPDVEQFVCALKTCVTVPLAQYEYDAYVSFAYNVGPRAFCQSTLVKKLNTQNYLGACAELLRWRNNQRRKAKRAEARAAGGPKESSPPPHTTDT